MDAVLPDEYAKQSLGHLEDARARLHSLYMISPGQFDAEKEMHSHHLLRCMNGGWMTVEICITLTQDCSLKAEDMPAIFRHSCEDYFEYALSTSHDKTVITNLCDRKANVVGEIVARFQRLGFPAPLRNSSFAKMDTADFLVDNLIHGPRFRRGYRRNRRG